MFAHIEASIIVQAFGFATANDSIAGKRPIRRSNDGALALAITTVVVDDDPIGRLSQLVCTWRVREKRRVADRDWYGVSVTIFHFPD